MSARLDAIVYLFRKTYELWQQTEHLMNKNKMHFPFVIFILSLLFSGRLPHNNRNDVERNSADSEKSR